MWRTLLIGAAACIIGASMAWAEIERNTESRTKPGKAEDIDEAAELTAQAEQVPPPAELQTLVASRATAIALAAGCQAAAKTVAELYSTPVAVEAALAPETSPSPTDAPVVDAEPAAGTPVTPPDDAQATPEAEIAPPPEPAVMEATAEPPTAMPVPAPEPVETAAADPPRVESEPPAADPPATAVEESQAVEPPVTEVEEPAAAPSVEETETPPPAEEPADGEPEDAGVQSLDDLAVAQGRSDGDGARRIFVESELAPDTAAGLDMRDEPDDNADDEHPATEEPALTRLPGWTPESAESVTGKPERRPDLSKHISSGRGDDEEDSSQPTADEQPADDEDETVEEPHRYSASGWRSQPPKRETPPDDPEPARPVRFPVPVPPPVEPAVDSADDAMPDAPVADPGTMSFELREDSRALLEQMLARRGEDMQVSAMLETAPGARSLVIAAVVDTAVSGNRRGQLGLRAPVEPVLGNWPPSMPKYDVPAKVREVSRGNSRRKQVALTFDDGPHPEFTSQLLAVLDFYGVPATFFFVGVQALKYPHWVKMSHQAGHEIGSQTYDHFRLPKLPLEEKVYQIDEYQRLIEGLIGVTPRFLRPPGGQYDAGIRELVSERGMVLGLWDVALNDTREGKTAGQMLKTARREIRAGSVVLAHDGIQATVDMLPELIESLRAQGYEFVTMSELASGL